MTNEKLKTLPELAEVFANAKKAGKTIVAASGSFDMLHAGQVEFLQIAKQQGDYLAVFLNSDESVRGYKGKTRPFIPEADRATLLAGLACVDYVLIFNELTPLSVLETLHPDVYCNGADWGENCVEKPIVEKHGGRIHIIKEADRPGNKASDIIKRIQDASSEQPVRAVFLDRDGTLTDNKDGYTYKIEDLELLPGVVPALRLLQEKGFKLILVTNQSGVGRKMFTEADVEKANNWVKDTLAKEGVELFAMYYCPHHPEDGCDCRKPGTGMLLAAAREHGIVFNGSWIIGDADGDIEAGRRSNLMTVKIGSKDKSAQPFGAHFYAKDLPEAAEYILSGKRV
jgi:rfaE bifunctional protein nucleotidyltransferase chain/domain